MEPNFKTSIGNNYVLVECTYEAPLFIWGFRRSLIYHSNIALLFTDSLTPTYAMTVMHINNKRWVGVPFIMRCGKGIESSNMRIVINQRDTAYDIYYEATDPILVSGYLIHLPTLFYLVFDVLILTL